MLFKDTGSLVPRLLGCRFQAAGHSRLLRGRQGLARGVSYLSAFQEAVMQSL